MVVMIVRGARPMMPAKMISEMPFPMPCSVISSPNHISITVPPVRVTMIVSRWNQSMSAGRLAGAAAREEVEQAEQGGLAEQGLERGGARAGDGDVREEPKDDQQEAGEEKLVAQLGQPDRVVKRLEEIHARLLLRGGGLGLLGGRG